MDFTGLLVQVISGAIGGSAAGAAAKDYSLGTLGNAIAGAIGGGAIGGIILMLLVGLIKNMTQK